MKRNTILCGDALELARQLPDNSINMILTSPPYWGLRCYGVDGQIGLEPTPDEHIGALVELFRELRRVLRDDGTLWLNYGDCYATQANGRSAADTKAVGNDDRTFRDKPFSTVGNGLKSKDLVGMAWRIALALQADGWYLRSDIIWHKPNPMPESVTDRPTRSHEYVFLLTKQGPPFRWVHSDTRQSVLSQPPPDYYWVHKETGYQTTTPPDDDDDEWDRFNKWVGVSYFYDADAIRERALYEGDERHKRKDISREDGGPRQDNGSRARPGTATNGRNKRTVWTVSTSPYSEAHFATFPPKLIEPMILAGCPHKTCAECGNPWVRVVEKVGESLSVSERHGRTGHNGQPPQISGNYWTGPTTKSTARFEPTCDCSAGTRPGIVLDPFIGSGTVAQVAIKHKRDWLGFELNPEYIEMAGRRIAQVQPVLFHT